MTGSIRVFVCYKRVLSEDRAGQRIQQRNTKAEIFHQLLSAHPDYEPWLDDARLSVGMEWETEIYRQLLNSDLVVVLIGPGTAESEWVRHEIALATALGISVLPVGFDITDEQMDHEVTALGINRLQWTITGNIRLSAGAALLAELDADLRLAAANTGDRQHAVLADLNDRRRPQPRKAADNQNRYSFGLAEATGFPLVLHVAAGDLAKIRGVDVIVNAENDYMQMAPLFETHTVSSILRRRGAQVRQGRYQDTIQQELDWQLRERGRPVQAGEVFPTSAGGPDSRLARENKARVILHVAAVQAVDVESRVIPYRHPHEIESSVRNILSTVEDLNRSQGVFSPEGSDQRAEQERQASAGHSQLTSILLPLLGTGAGGAPARDVVGPMLDGLTGYLSDPDSRGPAEVLHDIYLAAYLEDDVAIVVETLRTRFPNAER